MNSFPTRRAVTAGLLAAVPLQAAHAAPRLDEIVRRHTAARGGAAALERIRNVATDLDIDEQGATVQGRYRASLDGYMRIDVFVGAQRVFSEGIDKDGPWAWPGDKPAPTPEGGAAEKALRHGIDFNLVGLHRYAARGHRLTLAGEDTLDGVTYPVIQIDMADGFQTFRYIDPKTWLVARGRDVRALHPTADPSQKLLENVYADYRPVDGVQISFASHQADVATGKILQRTRLTRQRHNLPEAELGFARG